MDTKLLEQIGLTQGEIKTYLALLKIGSSSTGPIAKASQVSRSKLYSILDKLEKKGLVSHIEKKGVTYFQATEPSKINDHLAEKEASLEKLKIDFNNFLPQLEALTKSKVTQKVTLYQSLKGLQTAHEHLYLKLKRGDSYVYYGAPKHQPQTHHLYWQRDHLRRIKAGIKCKLLYNYDTPKEVLENRNNYKGCEARYMPTNFNTPSYFAVFADTTLIVIPTDEPLVVEIVSKEIADSFMSYFNDLWKRTKPFKN